MADVRVLLMTCQKYSWCLQPFAYLFNTYWSAQQPVVVGGVREGIVTLPDNFYFLCKSGCNHGPNNWSDSLIDALNLMDDPLVVILLEDYFLCRTADCAGISTLADYMLIHPEIVRMDLTTDRLYAGGMHDIEPFGHYDIIGCPKDSPYEMSLQAAIWNRRSLLTLLTRGKSSWEVEIHTDMASSPFLVRGTRQNPLRYANIIFKGKIADREIARIPEPQRGEIARILPKGWEHVDKYG